MDAHDLHKHDRANRKSGKVVEVELESIPESSAVRIGLGRAFVGVRGHWDSVEMQRAAACGAVDVPCAEWVPAKGQYRYFIRRAEGGDAGR